MNETPNTNPSVTESAPQEPRPSVRYTPPPLRPVRHPLFSSLVDDLKPMPNGVGVARVTESLLKCPGRTTYEIASGRSSAVMLSLSVAASLCLLGYGVIMGLFSGGAQTWVVPLKVWGGMLLSALLCLPSLYIFACLAGGRQSLGETIGFLIQSLALMGLLLAGFAPIAWLFAQSTNSTAFMGFLFLLFWLASASFGLELLVASLNAINQRTSAMLRIWCVVFIVVTLQMTTTLRPLLGPFEGFRMQEKQFFLAHWGDCMDQGGRR